MRVQVPPLVQILKGDNDENKRFAAYALAALADGSESRTKLIIEEGGAPLLFDPMLTMISTGQESQKVRLSKAANKVFREVVKQLAQDQNLVAAGALTDPDAMCTHIDGI